MSKTICHLFVGPSAPTGAVKLSSVDGVQFKPPIKRGDIPTLVRSEAPGVMAIADGFFHSEPAVGHTEILVALREGWTIYGLCSIGALRAAEMFSLGVKPFGRVAQRYVREPGTPDDFVALLHGPEPDYVPLSEPYVHLEAFLEHAVRDELLTGAQIALLHDTLTQCWYGYRTLPRARSLVLEAASDNVKRKKLHALLEDFDRFRIKQRDLVDFLEYRPWLQKHAEREQV